MTTFQEENNSDRSTTVRMGINVFHHLDDGGRKPHIPSAVT